MQNRKGDIRNGIEEPQRDDVPAMGEIFKSGQSYHHQLFPSLFCEPEDEARIHVYLSAFLKPRNPFRKGRRHFSRAWFEADVLGGYVLYQLYQSSDVFFGNDRWFAHVEDIAVSEDFRQRGIASKLLNSLTDEIEALGGGIVSGLVWNGNEGSAKLFDKSGFEATATQFYRVL